MSDESIPPPPESSKQPDSLTGQLVENKYRILATVATGGMGRIYKAEQLPLGRIVALKVLNAKLANKPDDTSFQKRFLREASILARLQYPNIVTVFDYGRIDKSTDSERYFMAMEFLSGETLQRRIARKGRLSNAETVQIAWQVGRGLREAHSHGVVHRDLKPSNIMLVTSGDGEETIKIVDFGIVKLISEDAAEPELTQEGSFLGSPSYMSPEQIGNTKVDTRTDLYSFGVILYQCLTGRLPYAGDTSMQLIMAHLNNPVIPFAERAPEVIVPEWLTKLVLRCLEKEPDLRPANLDEFLEQLKLHGRHGDNSGFFEPEVPAPPTGSPADITETSTASSLVPDFKRDKKNTTSTFLTGRRRWQALAATTFIVAGSAGAVALFSRLSPGVRAVSPPIAATRDDDSARPIAPQTDPVATAPVESVVSPPTGDVALPDASRIRADAAPAASALATPMKTTATPPATAPKPEIPHSGLTIRTAR